MLRQREDMEARLAKIRAKEKAQRERYRKGDQRQKKRKTGAENNDIGNDDEEQYVLDDYDSDNEQSTTKNGSNFGGLSAATLELMSKLGMNLQAPQEEDLEAEDEIKVRTRQRHPLSHVSNNHRSFSVLEHTLNLRNLSMNFDELSSRQAFLPRIEQIKNSKLKT